MVIRRETGRQSKKNSQKMEIKKDVSNIEKKKEEETMMKTVRLGRMDGFLQAISM